MADEGTPIVHKDKLATGNGTNDFLDFAVKEGNEKRKEKVWTGGYIDIQHGAIVHARQLGLKTIGQLLIQPDAGSTDPYYMTKWVVDPKKTNNYASVFIWNHDGSGVSGTITANWRAVGE